MGLKKNISVTQGVVLAICTIVGSGLLGLPGLAIETSGAKVAALAWPITTLISVPLVLVFLKLSLDVQDSGGIARYATIALGEWAGTAVTFILALTFMLCIPIGTYMGSTYIQKILGLPESQIFLISVVVLAVSTLLNYFGVKPSAWINKASALSMVVLVILFVVSKPELIGDGISAYRSYVVDWHDVSVRNIWGACAILYWAFLGWENLSFGSEEVKGGRFAIKLIFLIGFIAVTLLYGALALVAAGAHSEELNIAGVSGMLGILDGNPLAPFANCLIIMIVIANVNAWVFAASRMMYAAGRERILPGFLGRLSNNSIPQASLIFMLAVYILLSSAIHFKFLPLANGLMIANQNFIFIYIAVIICYVKLNRRIGSIIVAILSALSTAFIVTGFGWMLVIPVSLTVIGYAIHQARAKFRPAVGSQ
jgi:amino acid transporter